MSSVLVQVGVVLPIEVQVLEDDLPVDLSSGISALTIVCAPVRSSAGTRFTLAASVLTDGTDGWVTATAGSTQLAAGRWQLQVTWTDGTGARKSGKFDFTVDANL